MDVVRSRVVTDFMTDLLNGDSLGADSGAHQRRADTVSEANVPGSGEASLFFYGEPCAEQIVADSFKKFLKLQEPFITTNPLFP